MTLRHSSAGFTLIELMTVVIIVAVLLAIGLPAYQQQVIRGHRSAAKAQMLEIANRQQQLLLSDRIYTTDNDATTIDDLSYELPSGVAAKYEIFDLNTNSGSAVPAFTLTFRPLGTPQSDDGNLTLNSEGVKTPPEKWAR
jgi:type IV pilus assembly protein PilE